MPLEVAKLQSGSLRCERAQGSGAFGYSGRRPAGHGEGLFFGGLPLCQNIAGSAGRIAVQRRRPQVCHANPSQKSATLRADNRSVPF
jgi:hypothetical protein